MTLRVFRGDDEEGARECSSVESFVEMSDSHLLGQFIPLHYHYNMLQDECRIDSFRRAIEATVKPGMHVLELGGGTGVLSSFAARGGASVECVERNLELVQCSRRLIRANGLSKSIEVFHADACSYLPTRPVDLVICEMLHVGFLREKQLQVINAFKDNYSKSFGGAMPRFLPEATLLTFQAIEHAFDFHGYYAPIPLFQNPQPSEPKTTELSGLTLYRTVIYKDRFSEGCHWSGAIEIERSGFFSALRFITQNLIAMDVGAQPPAEWANQFLVIPLNDPIMVEAGELLEVSFDYLAGGSIESLSRSVAVRRVQDHIAKRAA